MYAIYSLLLSGLNINSDENNLQIKKNIFITDFQRKIKILEHRFMHMYINLILLRNKKKTR